MEIFSRVSCSLGGGERSNVPVRVGTAHQDVSGLRICPRLDVDISPSQPHVTLGVRPESVIINLTELTKSHLDMKQTV